MKRLSAKEYALYLLNLKDRSVGEMREKLKIKGFESLEIEKTITFLESKKFLDDERFTKNLLRNKLEFQNRGKARIWQELIKKKIDKNIIENAIENISEIDQIKACREASERWIRKKGDPKEYSDRQKLIAYLFRQGFGWNIIEKILHNKD